MGDRHDGPTRDETRVGGKTMSFDALTIAGILSALLAGGFLIALASTNQSFARGRRRSMQPQGCR